MDAKALVEALGIGFSHLLRYGYGGFLLVVFAAVMEPDITKRALDAMDWQLSALTSFVLGAGIYALHRSIIVPLHHGALCLLWWLADGLTGIDKEHSTNPTRWLASLNVPLWWRIPAYTILRRSELFVKEKASWDVAHAEAGMVLMTAEAFGVAAVYSSALSEPALDWRFLGLAAAVFLVFSFAGFVQHAVERMRFHQEKTRVQDALRAAGLIRIPGTEYRFLLDSQGDSLLPCAHGEDVPLSIW